MAKGAITLSAVRASETTDDIKNEEQVWYRGTLWLIKKKLSESIREMLSL